MKTIFLSASIPDLSKEENRIYFDKADTTAIRDAVLALVYVCLKLDIKIVWGGHPAITPIVYEAIRNYEEKERSCCNSLSDEEIKKNIQRHVHLFQSAWYKENLPEDNNKFENITLTEVKEGDYEKSMLFMRSEMLHSADLSSAIYIGGMEGIMKEDALFQEYYPTRPTYPIASTGGAALALYEDYKRERQYSPELLINYAYTSLFYSILESIG